MSNSKLHIVFAGPGGSGKSTLLSSLKKNHSELGLCDQVNDTTRMRRDNEDVSSDYNYILEQEYIEYERAGMYISKRKSTGKNKLGKIENQWYGLQAPENDKTAFILDGAGIGYLNEYCKKTGDHIFSIFCDVERQTGYERMLAEGEEGRAKTRDEQYEHFMGAKPLADYILNTNRSFPEVEAELVRVLTEVLKRHDERKQ